MQRELNFQGRWLACTWEGKKGKLKTHFTMTNAVEQLALIKERRLKLLEYLNSLRRPMHLDGGSTILETNLKEPGKHW